MLYIGYVAKTHGFNGQFSIKLEVAQDLCNLFKNIKTIYINKNPNPLLVTQTILNQNIFLKIKTSEITSRETAKSILRKNIYIKQGDHYDIDISLNKKNELLNFLMIDKKKGEIGVVKKIDFNRNQPLFLIQEKNRKILVPFVSQLIISIDHQKKTINVDLPEGLINICAE